MKSVILRGSSEPIIVNKIVCLGQNYVEHAHELKFEVPSTPVFFLKPSSAIIHSGDQIVLPSISDNVHHEVEMTVLIGERGKNIPLHYALHYVAGYGVGLDMTMRDIQMKAKKNGLPWSLAKGFDTSAPLSEFIPPNMVDDPKSLRIQLQINGRLKQSSSTNKLIFPIDKVIVYLSKFLTLERGDIIFTGTPEGVSRVDHGDKLEATLQNAKGDILVPLSVSVQ